MQMFFFPAVYFARGDGHVCCTYLKDRKPQYDTQKLYDQVRSYFNHVEAAYSCNQLELCSSHKPRLK